MNWGSASEFFAMGGYGFYVWGSFAAFAGALAWNLLAPRLSRVEAARSLSPLQMSFMRESRRIGNRRLKEELKMRLAYPTVDDGIRAALESKAEEVVDGGDGA